ncbi:hypothetical protein [Actinomadura rugatobispora]|uniref:Uncharacterized protein n=1 Tax=Actinomadura rugatobispora TaxID=1994 RepID=A0ABW1AGG3_9ACTN|nr:hypothetical protein GCM10010200_087670 [Actinomadura rugatobispora]
MTGYPAALALTLAVELPVYAVALRVLLRARLLPVLAAAVAVNLVTHPLVWWALGAAARSRGGYEIALLPVEIAAWLAEAALLGALLRRPGRACLHAALAANAASLLAGLVAIVA